LPSIYIDSPNFSGNITADGFAAEITLQRISSNIELLAGAKGKTVSTAGVQNLNKSAGQTSQALGKTGKSADQFSGKLTWATTGMAGFARATHGISQSFKSAMKGISGGSGDLGSGISAAGDLVQKGASLLGGAFSTLVGASGPLGRFAGQLVKSGAGLAGAIAGGLVGVIAQAATDFGKLQQAGGLFGGSLGEMRDAAVGAGLTLTQFSNVFRKNTALFAAFGGATSEGSRQFGEMNKEINNLYSGQFLRLGIGFEEITARNAESVEQFARAGINVMEMGNGAELVATRTRTLAMQQKQLAAFNGTTLEQEREKQKAAKMDVMLQSVLAGQSTKVRDAMEGLAGHTNNMHPGLKKLALQYFKFGGAADAASGALENQLGSVAGPMKEFVLGVKAGTHTMDDLPAFLANIDPTALSSQQKGMADIASISLLTGASLGEFGKAAEAGVVPLQALATKLNMDVLNKIEADMIKFGETPDQMTDTFIHVTKKFQEAAVDTQEAMNNILFGVRDDFLGTIVTKGAGAAKGVADMFANLAEGFKNLTETVNKTNVAFGGKPQASTKPATSQQYGGPFDAGEALMFETGRPEAITFNKSGVVTPTNKLFKSIMPDVQKMIDEIMSDAKLTGADHPGVIKQQKAMQGKLDKMMSSTTVQGAGDDAGRKREVEDAMLALPGLLMDNTDAVNKANVENTDSLDVFFKALA
jgi:hypothetical protein